VQTAKTFKAVREILICWLLLKKFVATSNRLFFYDLLIIFDLGSKPDTHKTVCVYALMLFLAYLLRKRVWIHSRNVNNKYYIVITPVKRVCSQ